MIVGIGTDVVDISRIQRSIEKYSQRFLNRIFTPTEQKYCNKKNNPFPHFSGRFATKEAFFKAAHALPESLHLSWLDVSVLNTNSGVPILILTHLLKNKLKKLSIRSHVTISHSHTVAVSTVLLEQ